MNVSKRAIPLALLLSGCATYTPRPLETPATTAMLDAPVASVLEAKANAIDRPWLAPVTLDLSKPLTPDAIATIAVVNNPDLKAQRVRAGVSDAQVFAAGLLPDPSVSLGVSKVLSGPDPLLDLTSGIGLAINALRTRGVTRTKAEADARQVRLDLAWAEWQTAGQARLQAARIVGQQQLVALAEQSRAMALSLLSRIQSAAGRGDIAGDRLQAAQLSLMNATDTLRTAQSNLADAREQLDKLLGFPPETAVELAPIGLPPSPPPVATLFALAKGRRTDLAALRAGYRSQEAAVHQAVLDQFPSLNLTFNSNRDSAGNLLVGPAVDFTLPLWNRNRGGIAVARATRAALKAEYDARLFQTRADIGTAVAGIKVAMQQRDDALSGLPELRRYALASQRAARRGDLSLETAQNAAQALRDRQMLVVQSETALMQQMIALELLTGAPREVWPQ